MGAKYQLVIQIPVHEDEPMAFEQLLELESQFEGKSGQYEVDGHDLGSGHMNIFLLTTHPVRTFEIVMPMMSGWECWKAAYRDLAADDYTVLWSADGSDFTIR